MLVDTHAHLNAAEFADDLAATVDRSVEAGVGIVICVGYNVETSRRAVELAAKDPRIFATVGVHPNYVAAVDASWKGAIRELATRPRVVGIGETGLDYFRRNEPAFTRAVGERVAELRGTTLRDLARLTTANACRVFPGVSGADIA